MDLWLAGRDLLVGLLCWYDDGPGDRVIAAKGICARVRILAGSSCGNM